MSCAWFPPTPQKPRRRAAGWFETIVMPVKREPNASKPDLVLMVFHDLTPLRRVEEMRADFVANASHELRTPAIIVRLLRPIRGLR